MGRKISALLLIIISMLLVVSCGNKKNEYTRIIVSVHDGDTFTDSSKIKYRLFAVDTPETSSQYNNFQSTEGIEKIYAFEATTFTKKLILRKEVQIHLISTDIYGRSVARIIINGKDLSIELVKAGLARVAYIDVEPNSIYETNNFKYFINILNEQRKARINKMGFWSREKYFSTIFPKA